MAKEREQSGKTRNGGTRPAEKATQAREREREQERSEDDGFSLPDSSPSELTDHCLHNSSNELCL